MDTPARSPTRALIAEHKEAVLRELAETCAEGRALAPADQRRAFEVAIALIADTLEGSHSIEERAASSVQSLLL